MKKISICLLALISIWSCGDEVEFNSPAYQASKNGVTWRATYFAGDIDNGGLVVQGGLNNEVLSLVTTQDNERVYELGGENQSEARFTDENGVTYSTLNSPDPSFSLYPAEGEIDIVDFVNTENGTIVSGTFWFTAYSTDGLQSVNFIRGVFHKVPLTGGLLVTGGGVSCDQAVELSNAAAAAFAETNPSMPDYSELCNVYKDALMMRIISCGNGNGAIQDIINSLGDCE